MVGWSLLTDFDAIKRAGVPILRSLNIRFRLKQQAREQGIYDLRLDFRDANLTKRSDCVLSLSYQSSIISRQSKILRVGL